MKKNCRQCGKEFDVKPSHYEKRHNCSVDCMAEEYRERMIGKENPNYRKGIYKFTCLTCGIDFESYVKTSKYCSRSCLAKRPDNIKRVIAMSPKAARAAADANRKTRYCIDCSEVIERKYAKYCDGCRPESCGKKDANHDEIVTALRGASCGVVETHRAGNGFPDIIVINGNGVFLLEIKNPDNPKYGLTKRQRRFFEEWRGQVAKVETIEQALTAVGLG